MRVRFFIAFLPVLASVGLTTSAAAQELTRVSVRTEIVNPEARLRFGARVAEVESRAARLFVAYLAPRVGFATFAANVDTLPYRIVFRLHQLDTLSRTQFEEIGFWAELRQGTATLDSRYWMKVRAADDVSSGIGGADAFLARLEADLLAHADPEPVRAVLRGVPIASDGFLQNSPPGWALRLRSADLCLLVRDDDRSVLRIAHELDEPMHRKRLFEAWITGEFAAGPQPPAEAQPYIGGIFMEPTDASRASLSQSLTEGKLLVKGVFLVTYRHDANSCRQRGGGSN